MRLTHTKTFQFEKTKRVIGLADIAMAAQPTVRVRWWRILFYPHQEVAWKTDWVEGSIWNQNSCLNWSEERSFAWFQSKQNMTTGFMRNTAEVSQGLALVALESFTLCMTGSTFDSENCLLAELGIQSFVMPPSKFRVKSRAWTFDRSGKRRAAKVVQILDDQGKASLRREVQVRIYTAIHL